MFTFKVKPETLIKKDRKICFLDKIIGQLIVSFGLLAQIKLNTIIT